MCTTLGGHCVCQITHHTNTDIFTALSLLQTLDYIHTHIYTKSQEQTLKKHAHLSGFHFLIKKGILYTKLKDYHCCFHLLHSMMVN